MRVVALLLTFLVSHIAATAEAQTKYDPAPDVAQYGRLADQGNAAAQLKVGQEAVFNVQPEGSVLSRTSVAVNGKKGALTDIKPGKTVLVYWVPDPKDAKAKFARKIDVILSEQELDERYGEAE